MHSVLPFVVLLLGGGGLLTGVRGWNKVRWTYTTEVGLNGPAFWGMMEPDWRMCKDGKMQSPIDVDPSRLIYDPALTSVVVDRVTVPARLKNTGTLSIVQLEEKSAGAVSIAGGPLGYKYRLYQVVFHFGSSEERAGSEHTIDHHRFPAEVQLIGYNSELYSNFTDAMRQPRGLMAISIMINIETSTEKLNDELKRLTSQLDNISNQGMETALTFAPAKLLPRDPSRPYEGSPTKGYITYEGSLTFPGCYETVTWLLINNPIYISQKHYQAWSELQGSGKKLKTSPKFLAPNYRPLQKQNDRPLRTNVHFKNKKGEVCFKYRGRLSYRANPNVKTKSINYN